MMIMTPDDTTSTILFSALFFCQRWNEALRKNMQIFKRNETAREELYNSKFLTARFQGRFYLLSSY